MKNLLSVENFTPGSDHFPGGLQVTFVRTSQIDDPDSR